MDHPNLKTDKVYCLKVPFLKTVKCNNFPPYDLSIYNCGPGKSLCYREKEKICPAKEECGSEKSLLWRRGRRALLLLLLPWCSKHFCNTQE